MTTARTGRWSPTLWRTRLASERNVCAARTNRRTAEFVADAARKREERLCCTDQQADVERAIHAVEMATRRANRTDAEVEATATANATAAAGMAAPARAARPCTRNMVAALPLSPRIGATARVATLLHRPTAKSPTAKGTL